MSTKTLVSEPKSVEQVARTMVFDSGSPMNRDIGICSTCNHNASCLFLKSARHPIAFCEEFDDSQKQQSAQRAVALPPEPQGINFEQGQAEGVCVTCAHRPSCVYRQPGVAVWDCSDFS